MNRLEAIDARVSRRSYTKTPIEMEKRQRLLSLMQTCNLQNGLNIRFFEDASEAFDGLSKSYGLFSGVSSVLALAGPADDEDLDEKLGYFGELLVLEATAMGLGTCWVGGTFDRRSALLQVEEGLSLRCVIPVGYAAEATFKDRLISRAAGGKRRPIEKLYTTQAPAPPWFFAGMAAVHKAPSARNAQPVFFTYTKEGRVYAGAKSGPFTMVDLGIAKCHFSLAAGGTFAWGNHGLFTKMVE